MGFGIMLQGRKRSEELSELYNREAQPLNLHIITYYASLSITQRICEA